MKYAMSDIHGCFNEFLAMLKHIDFKKNDDLYIIGDVIDRGPEPIKLLKYIMKHDNIHLIMGNHEKMMINELIGIDIEKSNFCWKSNGGNITYNQFNQLKKKEQASVLSFLTQLPFMLEVTTDNENYILLHGSPNKNFKEDYDSGIISEEVLWSYFDKCSSKEVIYPGKKIIVGHMPTFYYGFDGKIIYIGDKILIDCGCVFGYTLGCLCLDTQKDYYVKKGK